MHGPVSTARLSNNLSRNSILASLSSAEFECVRPFLQRVMLKERAVLQEPNRRVEYIHFFETGLVSLMLVSSGSTVEVATIDSRGFDPALIVLGANFSAYRSMVLSSGSAQRIHVDDLRSLLRESPQIREHLLRYVGTLISQCSQTALCGALHHLENRLAAWICLASDSIGGDIVPVTHHHLSAALGFDRVGVTKMLKRFEQEGLVEKMHKVLRICSRHALERKACSCYGLVTDARKQPRLAGTQFSCLSTSPSQLGV